MSARVLLHGKLRDSKALHMARVVEAVVREGEHILLLPSIDCTCCCQALTVRSQPQTRLLGRAQGGNGRPPYIIITDDTPAWCVMPGVQVPVLADILFEAIQSVEDTELSNQPEHFKRGTSSP